jgi:hypothetical protein
MTNNDIHLFIEALKDIVANYKEYSNDYIYEPRENHYRHKNEVLTNDDVLSWFKL